MPATLARRLTITLALLALLGLAWAMLAPHLAPLWHFVLMHYHGGPAVRAIAMHFHG